MKMSSLFVAAGLSVASTAQSAEVLAGPTINPANGHTYYLVTNDTWANSQVEANRLGGHLVTIDDASENDWVFTTFASFGGTPRGLWIGLTDVTEEGEFVWVDGSSSGYRNWAEGEPNDGNVLGEDIVQMWHPGHEFAGQWNDHTASALNSFDVPIHGVVEIPGPVVSIRVSEVVFQWHAGQGVNYQPQYRTSLESNWQDLGMSSLGPTRSWKFAIPLR